jgi:hypothetical protein
VFVEPDGKLPDGTLAAAAGAGAGVLEVVGAGGAGAAAGAGPGALEVVGAGGGGGSADAIAAPIVVIAATASGATTADAMVIVLMPVPGPFAGELLLESWIPQRPTSWMNAGRPLR